MPARPPPELVLASASPYRQQLLTRLRLPFATAAPNVDESPVAGEAPRAMVLRLACAKAQAVAPAFPSALIIGSDQVAVVEGTLINKPGDYSHAVQQLRLMQGHCVSFLTALCVLNGRTLRCQKDVVETVVHMRGLSNAQIERYLEAERPYDCAGSARIEGYGIALVEKLEGDDPSALIGLPLIKLCAMLGNEGIELP